MDFWIKTGQLLLSLSILIVLHEGGHFVPARLFKIRVEKFYLFFDPWFSLVKKKIGDTVYGIGWLPLGGYVKISGMIDESMDKDQMAKPPEPHEFRSKPAWQRLIVMLGGVTVNFVLALVIYVAVCFVWGKDYLPIDEARWGYDASEIMEEYGAKDGDLIVSVGSIIPESFNDVDMAILIEGERELTLNRNGKDTTLIFPEDFDQVLLRNGMKGGLFMPMVPTLIDSVFEDKPAVLAGLQKGDSLVFVNGVEVPFFGDFRTELKKYANQEITLGYYRNGVLDSIKATPDSAGMVGFKPNLDFTRWYSFTHIDYSFGASVPAGIGLGLETFRKYVLSLRLLFTAEGAGEVGGFAAIGNMFEATWDWHKFWMMTAFLSIMLAFLNVLPIPALDGGHVVFLLWEIIARKPAPQKLLERAQLVGMILLLGLVLYANGNDFYKWLSGK